MSQQTLMFNLDVPYKDENGEPTIRKCVLTLTVDLSVDDVPDSNWKEGYGPVTLGAVIVVEDPMGKPAPVQPEEEPMIDEQTEQKAA